LPSPTASSRLTVPAPLQVAPGLRSASPLAPLRSTRPPARVNTRRARPPLLAPGATKSAVTGDAAAKRLVRPTPRVLQSAQQGYRPAQTFVLRHQPPLGLVSRPPRLDMTLQSSTPHPPPRLPRPRARVRGP
jgi:hypothetical protein